MPKPYPKTPVVADKKRGPKRPAKASAKEDPGALRAFMVSKMAGR